VSLVRRLSPDSLPILEFRGEQDASVAKRMAHYPPLSEEQGQPWSLRLANEFHMTNDGRLFRTSPDPGRLPLVEGKMIHQFSHRWGQPRYWLDEDEAAGALLAARLLSLTTWLPR